MHSDPGAMALEAGIMMVTIEYAKVSAGATDRRAGESTSHAVAEMRRTLTMPVVVYYLPTGSQG